MSAFKTLSIALFLALSLSSNGHAQKKLIDLGRLHLALPEPYAKSPFTIYEGYVLNLVLNAKTFEPVEVSAKVQDQIVHNIGLSIETAQGLSPPEKLVQLYPRYLDMKNQLNLAENLISTPFRAKSPFEHEILITDSLMSGHVIVFCPKFETPPLPKSCIAHFRFADALDVHLRFIDKDLYKVRDYIAQTRMLLSEWAQSAKEKN